MDEKKYWREADNEYDWFDQVYQAAGDNYDEIPWAKCQPNRLLVPLLSEGRLSGEGQSAVVVGCGLGDDAELLAAHGFTVTAFDISAVAISQARRRFPDSCVAYQQADLFNLPPSYSGGFDLVFEASTLQALPRHLLQPAQEAVASLLAPGGQLVVVAFGRQPGSPLPEEPPWPLLKSELDYFQQLGLEEADLHMVQIDRGGRPGPRYRIIYTGNSDSHDKRAD